MIGAAEIAELRAQRRANRRKMKTASPAVLELCQRLDEVLAVLIYKLKDREAMKDALAFAFTAPERQEDFDKPKYQRAYRALRSEMDKVDGYR